MSALHPLFQEICEAHGAPKSRPAEAARLAHLNPGRRFHVLASHRVSFVTTDIAEYADELAA